MFEDANEVNQKPKIEEGQTMQWPLQGVPLHLHTYSCKYETATYLKRFFVVDIAYGIEIRPNASHLGSK
jgi:hypothetical protein